jgi:hypothetical protein
VSLRVKIPDHDVVAAVLDVANSSWEPPALTALWKRKGWTWSRAEAGFSIPRKFVLRPADPELTDGRPGGAFSVDFCVFMSPDDDPDGHQLTDGWDGPKWPLRRDANRGEFDEACHRVIATVTSLLGPPLLAGRDDVPDQPWLHALWRIAGADRVLAVLQRDNSDLELGSLCVREQPADAPLPAPDQPFVDWLYR